MLEYWVSKAEKVLLLVQERFAEARAKEFLTFSLKSAAGGRSSNLYQGNAARSDFFGGLESHHELQVCEHEHDPLTRCRPPSFLSYPRSSVVGQRSDIRGQPSAVFGRNDHEHESQLRNHSSAVVGSMMDFTSETRLAANPARRACSRIISSLGAMYTQ
jgi:hypothetical protein